MKKALFAVALILVAGVVAVGIIVVQRAEQLAWEPEVIRHFAQAEAEGSGVIAKYQAQRVQVVGPNIGRLIWALTIAPTQRERRNTRPQTEGDPIELRIASDTTIEISVVTGLEDAVLLDYRSGSKQRYYIIQNYRSWYWLQRITSPEGEYSPNLVLSE